MNLIQLIRTRATAIAAILLIALAYSLARIPGISHEEERALAARFHFQKTELPRLASLPASAYNRSIRDVNPSLEQINGWISSVGAAVALADLDGDGLPNDLVYVDPRVDKVIVAPVPGTEEAPSRKGRTYQPFALDSSLVDPAKMAPMGAVCGDFNEDGLMDVLVYYWGRSPIIFYRKSAGPLTGADDFRPVPLTTDGQRWFTNAVVLTDLDGDGHLDLVIGNYFEDGSEILDAHSPDPQHMQEGMPRSFNGGTKHFFLGLGAAGGQGPCFREVQPLDENGNPYPQQRGSDGKMHANTLFTGWTLAMGAQDLNGDGLPELYIGNDFGPDRLFENFSVPGSIRLKSVTGRKTIGMPNSRVLGNDSFKGMGVEFADLNGDGIPDILVSDIADQYALEESHLAFLSQPGEPVFQGSQCSYIDHSDELGIARDGWGWDVKTGDFDNSGDLEILRAVNFVRGHVNRWPELHEAAMRNDRLLTTPTMWPVFHPGDDISGWHPMPFYARRANGQFVDIGQAIGLYMNVVSRGIATADVDGNGKLDFAVADQWAPSFFFRNVAQNDNAYLGLHVLWGLDGKQSSDVDVAAGHPDGSRKARPAVGVQADVTLDDGRVLHGQVDCSNGHSGKRAPDLLFGLGPYQSRHISVRLRWRYKGKLYFSRDLACGTGWNTLLINPDAGGEK